MVFIETPVEQPFVEIIDVGALQGIPNRKHRTDVYPCRRFFTLKTGIAPFVHK